MTYTIEVNSKVIEARKGDTILATLRRNGIKVPTLCSMKGLSPTGACRFCVVEVEGISNLVTSCSYPVEAGMRVSTHSPRVVRARKTLVELLLSNHPDDCLYCQRNNSCELQAIAADFNIRERRISGRKSRHKLDLSSPCLIRDPSKCILCGRCVRVCEEIQMVNTFALVNRGSHTHIGTAMGRNLNFSNCIGCGQCVMMCPTAALHEQTSLDEVQDALNNSQLKVVVQYGPSITVSLAEEFGIKPGKDWNGVVVAALRKIGFDFIFDTSFGADVAIMETVSELTNRIQKGSDLPMVTSCCPAWVKYAEQSYPQLLPLLSSCKSPQQVMGAIIKTHLPGRLKIPSDSIHSVSIMPCLAKKFEAQRVEMTSKGISDVDTVLSTRELAKLIRLYGIDMNAIEPQQADVPFGTRSSAGKLFAISGGTSEGVARTLYHSITGKDLQLPKLNDLRAGGNVKEVVMRMGKQDIKFLLVNGMTGLQAVLASIEAGQYNAHFVEIMACPGGCVNGGGQPFGFDEREVKGRTKAIYDIDETETNKLAHRNPAVVELYKQHLEAPGSPKAKKLLHTSFTKRNVVK